MQSPYELAAALRSGPWALTPDAHGALLALAEAAVAGQAVQAAAGASRAPRRTTVEAGTAVIPVIGPIEQRPGWLSLLGFGTNCAQISAAVREAVADPAVKRLLLYVDSPGGTVAGTPELADEIFAARRAKPVVGIVEGVAGSAAYWLASQCSRVYATKSSEVGSIGVYCAHQDASGALAQAGLKITLISAGRHKTEGNPLGPLTDEARAFMQERVDEYFNDFVGAVARGRGVTPATVRAGMGQGRMLGASQALAERMIDGVATLSDVLAGKAGVSGTAAGAVAVSRSRWRQALVDLAEAELPRRTQGLTLVQAKRQLDML